MIAMKELPHPHTSNNIYDKMIEILRFWGIGYDKVLKIVTDNAANMIKAFNRQAEDIDSNDSDDEEFCSDEENSSDGDEYFCADANLDESFTEENDCEFESMQEEQQLVWRKKHLRCVVHTLQLVVRKFEKIYASSTLKAAIALVNKFQKSSKLTTRLRKLANGKKLRPHCATRWSSLFRMIDRLLDEDVKAAVIKICDENQIDNLLRSQRESLKELRSLLENFCKTYALIGSKQSYHSITRCIISYYRFGK